MLDQPSDEILRLEQIMEAYAKYDKYEQDKADARARNAKKHAT